MKTKVWAVLPLLIVALSYGSSKAQDDDFSFDEDGFEEESFDDFEDETTVSAPPPASKPAQKKAASSSSSPSDDFSDADFSDDSADLSFEDFDSTSEEGGDVLVDEGFSAPTAPTADADDFELEPWDESTAEPPVAQPEPVVPEPVMPEPAFEAPPIIATPTPEPEYAPPAYLDSDAGPDLALEARLHDIYINFHSQSISRDQWEMITGNRQSDIYSIQAGDNLWGVSRTLFNDGHYWPKIWSLNKGIQNPHVIEPGDQLQFVMGSEEEAPSFTVGSVPESEEVLPVTPAPRSVRPQGSSTEVELPPPLVEPRPILRKLPGSLPEIVESYSTEKYGKHGIQVIPRPVLSARARIYLSGYVDEPTTALGKIVEIEGGLGTATDFQYVYILVKKGSANAGDRMLVVTPRGPLRPEGDFIQERSRLKKAVEMEIQGAVKLDAIIAQKGKPNPEYDMYRALVEKSIQGLHIGSEVRVGSLPMVEMTADGERSDVVAQITGGIFDGDRKIFGDQNIVFLSRGSQDGLAEGQILTVRSNEAVRSRNSKIGEIFRPIGTLKIAKVTSTFATAVVLKAWDEIMTGDFTGTGPLISSASDFEIPARSDDSSGSVEVIPGDDADDSEDFLDGLEDDGL